MLHADDRGARGASVFSFLAFSTAAKKASRFGVRSSCGIRRSTQFQSRSVVRFSAEKDFSEAPRWREWGASEKA
jgi:hypothetical protein